MAPLATQFINHIIPRDSVAVGPHGSVAVGLHVSVNLRVKSTLLLHPYISIQLLSNQAWNFMKAMSSVAPGLGLGLSLGAPSMFPIDFPMELLFAK